MRTTSRPGWLFLLLSLLTLSVLALAMACGGDDDDGDDGGNEPSASASDSGDDTGDDDDEASPTEDSGDDDSGDDDSGNDNPFANLDDFTADIEQQTGKVSYDITDTDGTVTTMTYYSDADTGYSRFDTIDEDGNGTSLITNGDGDFSCDSSSQTCTGFGSGGLGGGVGLGFAQFFSADYIGIYVAAAEAAGVAVDQSSESIAGEDADCFSWTDPEDSSNTGKLCFGSDSRALLYQEFGDSSGTTKFEATSYSDEVSDSDFELPYPVSTIISTG